MGKMQEKYGDDWFSKITPHYASAEDVKKEMAKVRLPIKTNYTLGGSNLPLQFEHDINMLYADKQCGYEIERVFLYNLIFDEADRLCKNSNDKKIVFLSYEKEKDFVLKQLCKIGAARGFRENELTHIFSKILILDDLTLYMESILKSVELHHNRYSMIFIDSFHYLRFDKSKYDNTKDNEVYVSHELHFYALKYHIPFIITDTFRGKIKSANDLDLHDVRIYEVACVAPICLGLFAENDKRLIVEFMKNRHGKSNVTTTLSWSRDTMVIEHNLKPIEN